MSFVKCSILLLLALGANAQIPSRNSTNLTQLKIYGGHEIDIRDVPFLLAMCNRERGCTCGGSVISRNWGLSALHCVQMGMERIFYVRAGSSTIDEGGYIHTIRKFYAFSSIYYDIVPKHDIVLFRVKERFRFSDAVQPAKLPVHGKIPPKILQVSGWGRTESSMQYPVSLHAVNVSSASWNDCDKFERVTDKRWNICYGQGGGFDSCDGDSGGPLADSTTIYGIVSLGGPCGVGPAIYAKVSYYRAWIKSITRLSFN